jgi:hypothetical protein
LWFAIPDSVFAQGYLPQNRHPDSFGSQSFGLNLLQFVLYSAPNIAYFTMYCLLICTWSSMIHLMFSSLQSSTSVAGGNGVGVGVGTVALPRSKESPTILVVQPLERPERAPTMKHARLIPWRPALRFFQTTTIVVCVLQALLIGGLFLFDFFYVLGATCLFVSALALFSLICYVTYAILTVQKLRPMYTRWYRAQDAHQRLEAADSASPTAATGSPEVRVRSLVDAEDEDGFEEHSIDRARVATRGGFDRSTPTRADSSPSSHSHAHSGFANQPPLSRAPSGAGSTLSSGLTSRTSDQSVSSISRGPHPSRATISAQSAVSTTRSSAHSTMASQRTSVSTSDELSYEPAYVEGEEEESEEDEGDEETTDEEEMKESHFRGPDEEQQPPSRSSRDSPASPVAMTHAHDEYILMSHASFPAASSHRSSARSSPDLLGGAGVGSGFGPAPVAAVGTRPATPNMAISASNSNRSYLAALQQQQQQQSASQRNSAGSFSPAYTRFPAHAFGENVAPTVVPNTASEEHVIREEDFFLNSPGESPQQIAYVPSATSGPGIGLGTPGPAGAQAQRARRSRAGSPQLGLDSFGAARGSRANASVLPSASTRPQSSARAEDPERHLALYAWRQTRKIVLLTVCVALCSGARIVSSLIELHYTWLEVSADDDGEESSNFPDSWWIYIDSYYLLFELLSSTVATVILTQHSGMSAAERERKEGGGINAWTGPGGEREEKRGSAPSTPRGSVHATSVFSAPSTPIAAGASATMLGAHSPAHAAALHTRLLSGGGMGSPGSKNSPRHFSQPPLGGTAAADAYSSQHRENLRQVFVKNTKKNTKL